MCSAGGGESGDCWFFTVVRFFADDGIVVGSEGDAVSK